MNCPICGTEKAMIGRSISKEDSIVRRRVCENCGHRWNTIEVDLDQYDSMCSTVKSMKYNIKLLENQNKELTAKILKLGGKL